MSHSFLFVLLFFKTSYSDCYNCTECGCLDSHYFINFANSTKRTLSNDWTFGDDCNYCTDIGPEGDQCTYMNRQYVDIEMNGAVFTTTKLDTPSDCGANCASAHIEFTDYALFGTFIINAQFFFGESNIVKTATGVIGLNHDDNTDGITFLFHGKGWIGDKDNDWNNDRFSTNCYADRVNIGKLGNEIHTSANYDIANEVNEYKIVWTPGKVAWYFNGDLVRSTFDTQYIPQQPLQLRLNTRSSACYKMKIGKSFTATFASFEYIPYDENYKTTEYESSFVSNGMNGNRDGDVTLFEVVLSWTLSILCVLCVSVAGLMMFRGYKKKKVATKKIVHNISAESNEIGISKDLDEITTKVGDEQINNDHDIALPETTTKGMESIAPTEGNMEITTTKIEETKVENENDECMEVESVENDEFDKERISLEMEQMKMDIAKRIQSKSDEMDPVIE